MKRLFSSSSIIVALLLGACASPPASQDTPQSGLSSDQILAACVQYETPIALQKVGIKFRTREDASQFVQLMCQMQTRICAAQPGSDACQMPLRNFGLGDPDYVPSPEAALYKAAERGDTALVRDLLVGGANPNWLNAIGWTPLMIAAAERQLETVVVLLEAKADPNARNRLGRTALMFAAGYGQDAIVERLLAAGASINLTPSDQSGWTALIAAAAADHASTVDVLLRSGADPTIKSKAGETALDIARQQGHAAVTRILQTAAEPK